MSAGHDVFHHVRDSKVFELPEFMGGHLHIPQPFGDSFTITKFMLLEVVAALIVLVIFRGLVKRLQSGEPVRGRWWNFWESLAVFIRDNVVRAAIGEGHHHHDDHAAANHEHDHAHAHPVGHVGDPLHGGAGIGGAVDEGTLSHPVSARIRVGHPADKYLPYVWSVFFFILICNLLGAIPFLGSPTGHLWVTGVLAVSTLAYVIFAGSKELGIKEFWIALVPGMDLPFPIKVVLFPMMWVIELVGLLIKHGVLAVRLFANIMAGHTVIAVMLGFIAAAQGSLIYLVAPASVLGQVGIGLLELFVAFLQAYIFAFLASLFIGAAVHPH